MLRYSLLICAAISVGLGGFWLIVWLAGVGAEWSTGPVFIPTTNVAFGLLAGGAALLILAGQEAVLRHRWVGGVLAAVVFLMGFLTFGEHLFRFDLGIDQLLAMGTPRQAGLTSPNRMGPPAAVSFTLLGAGLLSLLGRRRTPAPYFGIAVCLVNLVPAIGYLYGLDEFYRLPTATAIAWPTLVGILALGIGLVLARSDGGPMAMLLRKDAGGILLRWLLPFAISVPLVLGFLRVQGQRHGLYDTAFGTGLLVAVMAVLFSAALWPTAKRLSQVVAEEAQAQRAVRTGGEQLRLFIEHAPASLAMFDRQMRYLYASRHWLLDYHLGDRDLRGVSHYEIFPEISAAWKEAHRRGLAGEILSSQGERFDRADGSVQWIRWEIRPWHDAAGEVGGIVIFTEDITERALAEERIAHLSSFPELNPNPIFETNLEGRLTYTNPAARRRFPELAVEGSRHSLLRGWSHVYASLRASGELSTVREVESGGRIFQQTIHYAPELGAVRAYLADITEHKLADEALKKQADLLKLSFDAIILWRLEGGIESWNIGAERLYGFSESEVLGRVTHDLLSTVFPKPWPQIEADLLQNGSWEGELRHRTRDGREVVVSARKQLIKDDSGMIRVLEVNRDITERKRVEKERDTAVEFLRLVNSSSGTRDLVQAATTFFQEQSGCEAVGIRLRNGDDYPYYEARGFSKEFVLMENSLCSQNAAGEVIRDGKGNPLMECMCGNVIRGRFDSSKPFFTANGSFWTNCTTELLATTSEADRQARTRNRCNGEGYESVALIPIRMGEETLGLLQLNDRRKGRFSPEIIAERERLGGYLAVGLAKARAEEALRQSLERLERVMEVETVGVMFWDLNTGCMVDANDAFLKLMGYSRSQVEARELTWQKLTPPEYMDVSRAEVEKFLATGRVGPYEKEYFRKDGTRQWLLFAGSSLGNNQCVEFCVDISDRKKTEAALRESEQRWAVTLRSIGDAVISTCAQGKIIFMNDVAQKLTGWTLDDAAGKHLDHVFRIVQEVTRIKPESPVAKVIRSGLVVGLANHTLLIRRDGTEIPIEDSGAPIRKPDGTIDGVVLVFHDVSEQRKVEAALRNSDRLATTGRLAATIAHEIHNPLDAVGNLLYLIDKETKEESSKKYASLASEELGRVTHLTRNMLTFQRDAHKPIPVKMRDVLENVRSLWEKRLQSAGIDFRAQIDYEGEFMALPGELRQVFANLVGNAAEAIGTSPHGKIRVHAFQSKDRRRGRTGLRVTVADNGPGIPAEVRSRIFDPFFTTKGEGGTGLGLWIISDIVRKYDAVLSVRSTTRAGRSGTCFSVFFPIPN